MAGSGRLKLALPVIGAGLMYLLLAAGLIWAARVYRSSTLAGLGSELAFDGLFYLFGGTISKLLDRARPHWLSCTTRESLELVALTAGTLFFLLGAVLQPSTETSAQQAIVGLLSGPIVIAVSLYWHRRIEHGHSHHEGFGTHLRIDALGAMAVMVGNPLAYVLNEPSANFWAALMVLPLALLMSIKPARAIISRMWHRQEKHHATSHPA